MEITTLQEWAPIIGFVLPAIQMKINEIVTKDIKVWKFSIKQAEQRFLISCALSFIVGLLASIHNNGIDFTNLTGSATSVFAISQVVFYTYFKKKQI